MKNFDNSYLTENIRYIAGTDEAGRGPLAGPVVAAAVIFKPDIYIEGVNDSKQLTEKERENLLPQILQKCLTCSVSVISHIQIERINILQASLLAMTISVDRLKVKPDLILVDGNKGLNCHIHSLPIIKGDSKSFAVASASIIAKVARDRIMKRLHLYYPHYNWFNNKGYGTVEHIVAIKKYGPCPLHRTSFLRNIMFKLNSQRLEFETEQ
ncbi:MAG: ribonuclease HII [Ignavibacteriaceae bacterium]|nr:ribonuclease HII [Ignavibacteriaceae bacterium]